MCLKTDTILLQYSFFYHFQYFIIACLCTVEIYLEMFKLNSFHGNDLMVLWDWSRLINKLSLIRSLNLFASEARISKWSNSVEQLHSSMWSDTADFLTLLRHFPVKLHTHMLFSTSKKGELYFTVISNLAVTTRVSVNNVRADLFLEGIFITQQRTQLTRWLQNNFKFTEL